MSSGDTRRFERSMYPVYAGGGERGEGDVAGWRTLLLVDTEDDDDLVPADPDELLDAPDAAARELREQNHALDIVILELWAYQPRRTRGTTGCGSQA